MPIYNNIQVQMYFCSTLKKQRFHNTNKYRKQTGDTEQQCVGARYHDSLELKPSEEKVGF